MVTDALLAILIGLIKAAMDALPNWNIVWGGPAMNPDGSQYWNMFQDSSSNDNAMLNLLVMMKRTNDYIPVDHIVAILSAAVAFWTVLWAWRAIKLLVGWIRGAGT